MLQCVRAMNLAIGLLSVSTAALAADDGFMAIHMDNQKTGSEVWRYWRSTTVTASN